MNTSLFIGEAEVNKTDVVPLTFDQRLNLLGGCIPLIGFSLLSALYFVVFVPLSGPPPLALIILIVVVIAYMTYISIQRIRDIASGVAFVREDTVKRVRKGNRPGSGWLGWFEDLGLQRMQYQSWLKAAEGHRHRVVYSPHSRFVWSVEPLRDGLPAHMRKGSAVD